MSEINEWWLWIIGLIIIIILLWYTYTQDDCIGGKQCVAYVNISASDPPSVIKQKIQEIVDKSQPVVWPLSLAVALAVTIPLIYFVTDRNPTLIELFVGVLFVFIGVWFAFSWTQAHFYQPNLERILQAVNYL